MKNSLKRTMAIAACALSAVLGLGALAACDTGAKPEHTAAKSANCTTAGNKEYWVKDGKYYSDEACTKEISKDDTVIPALNHDFTDAEYVSDDTQHWQVCIREGCNEISAKEDHDFTDGDCECGKIAPVRHVEAKAPKCNEDGNIEYWVKGGKYYSDEACTDEISQADTVRAKTGVHTPADEYTKEEYKHYHACVDCGEVADEKEDHTFTNGTCEVCGKTTGFEDVILDVNDSAAATRTDTASSVKVNITSGGTDWHIKLSKKLTDLAVGDAFAVKYYVTSNAAGKVHFEINGDDKNNNRNLIVEEGMNVITAYGVVHNEGDVFATLQLGEFNSGELEFTEITCEKLTGTGMISTLTKPGDSVVNYNKTDNADGTVNIAVEAGDGTDWHLKLEQRLNLAEGKTYDMVYVVKVNSAINGKNLRLEISDSAADFTGGNEFYWYDKGETTLVIRYRFTAAKTADSVYSCLLLGELTNASNALNLDFLYGELIEVA